MHTAPDRSAIVIGGSIAGLFSALLLLRRGWDVQVFERASEQLSGRGAGIVTHDMLWRLVESAGIPTPEDAGVVVRRRTVLDRDGTLVGSYSCRQVMTAWDRMFRLLRDALPNSRYHPGHDLSLVHPDPGGVEAQFANGARVRASLLIGADGIRSAVRQQILPNAQPCYCDYTAWRGLVDEADIPPWVHAALFADFAFCLPPGEQILGYPVAGPKNDMRAGHRRYNFVWYRPANQAALADLLTDAAGHVHHLSIPPPLIRPELIARMRADAQRLLAPEFATLVQATRLPLLQPIYDLETPGMAACRVALVGDAAFVARPHIGAGVTKAAMDAQALAEALEAAPVPQALREFERSRRPVNRRIVHHARLLGAALQGEELPGAAAYQTPQAVMAETALLGFLDQTEQ